MRRSCRSQHGNANSAYLILRMPPYILRHVLLVLSERIAQRHHQYQLKTSLLRVTSLLLYGETQSFAGISRSVPNRILSYKAEGTQQWYWREGWSSCFWSPGPFVELRASFDGGSEFGRKDWVLICLEQKDWVAPMLLV